MEDVYICRRSSESLFNLDTEWWFSGAQACVIFMSVHVTTVTRLQDSFATCKKVEYQSK